MDPVGDLWAGERAREVDQRAAGVYDLADHSVWCPKHRRNLPRAVPKSLDPAIRSIAAARGFEGQDLQVLADRVHLVVSAPPTESPVGIVKALKGPTANLMLAAPPVLRTAFRTGHLWSSRYLRRYGGDTARRSPLSSLCAPRRRAPWGGLGSPIPPPTNWGVSMEDAS
jgi:putative transposase